MLESKRVLRAVEFADIKDDYDILDLGAGSGNQKVINHTNKDINYTSVDITGGDVVYDLEKGLPPQLADSKFDVIFLLDVLGTLENFKTILYDCKVHLKKEGKIIITIPTNYRYFRIEAPDQFHTFRKGNLINLFNLLDMNYEIRGVHIRIPYLNVFIPSKQLVYNDTFLIKLSTKRNQ